VEESPGLATLRQARTVATSLAGGILLFAVVAVMLRPTPATSALAPPAGLAGIVSPLIGYRLYSWLRERVPGSAGPAQRRAAFLRATLLSLSVTDVTAAFGLVVYLFTEAPSTLIGVASHVILTGAVWPTEERLESFLRGAPDGGAG